MAPLVIAHRGDSAHRPENTLASFASALEVGADLVELDVQLTRDGAVVVIHDPTLERTTSGRGDVREMALREVRAVSAGFPARFGDAYAGEHVPTLPEVLGLVRDRARAVEHVRRAGMEGDVALISFSRRALLRCRDMAPEIARGHLFYRAEAGEVLAGARDVASDLVMPEKGMLSDHLRDRAREAGLKVATWVVDDPAELASLARFELYGIGSNRPGVLLEAIRDGG